MNEPLSHEDGSGQIEALAQRPYASVMRWTSVFAIGGAVAEVASHTLSAWRIHVGLLWGLWVPLCFLVIPTVHLLSRRMVRLEQRLQQLEARLPIAPPAVVPLPVTPTLIDPCHRTDQAASDQ